MELILKENIRINKPREKGGNVESVDTTVQGKSIIFPTDDKPSKKVIKNIG